MSTPTYVGALNGLYKQVYAKSIEDAVPAAAHILKRVPFQKKEQIQGLAFNQPVILTQEQGWSYIQAGSATPTLYGSVSMQLQNAQFIGNIIAGQCSLTVEAVKRAVSSAAAFEDTIGLQMKVMMASGKKRQEINFLYGNTPLALANSSVNSNTHQTVVTIVTSEFAAGFWAGMQNAQFDAFYTANGTQINTSNAYSVVTSNATALSVTFNNPNTTDLAALDTACASAGGAVGFYFYNAYGNESNGLKAQLTNTGTLFGINAAQYDLWNGNQFTVPSPGVFSFSQLQKAIAVAVGRGLDEDVTVFVNPNTWANLLTDQAALRLYTSASGTFTNGGDKLEFSSQNGKVEIVPHIYIKNGDAFILPMDKVKRIGVAEMSFDIPGMDKGKIFIQNPTSLSFEYRAYSQETIFLELPARGIYVNGIVNQ
jgi:hypothetical protein